MDDISKVYIYLLNDTIIENLQDINDMSIVMLKGEKGNGAGTWGEIDGNISNQTDLKNALALKANQSALNTTNANVSTNTSNISTLQAEVSALGNGSPEVVDTVAEMIDTTKTYIYVGTETGYTSGDWYYYDGSDWVSGGAYGSGGGGISDNARNLLKYVLERVAYTETGMQIYVDALYEALKQIDSPPTETYTILNTLVNVTNSNSATSISSGSSYSATLSVESGYTWGTVTITMGETDITSTAYNSSTHEISIASVTGDLVIIASATAPVTTYTITNALSHVSNSNTSASIQANSSYSGTLTADTGYDIDSVTVTMGGTDITSTAYTSATGAISIASVTGNIVITASAVAHQGVTTLTALNSLISLGDITLTSGYINDQGAVGTLANSYFYDQFVSGNAFAIINSSGGVETTTYRIAKYDENQSFLGRSYNSGYGCISNNNTKYMKMGFTKSGGYGNTYSFLNCQSNLADICTIANTRIGTDGTTSSSSGDYASDYIPISVTGTGAFFGNTTQGQMSRIAFYDASKNFISYYECSGSSGRFVQSFEITSQIAYCRISTKDFTTAGTSFTFTEV